MIFVNKGIAIDAICPKCVNMDYYQFDLYQSAWQLTHEKTQKERGRDRDRANERARERESKRRLISIEWKLIHQAPLISNFISNVNNRMSHTLSRFFFYFRQFYGKKVLHDHSIGIPKLFHQIYLTFTYLRAYVLLGLVCKKAIRFGPDSVISFYIILKIAQQIASIVFNVVFDSNRTWEREILNADVSMRPFTINYYIFRQFEWP